jgi:hypothetical protein
MATQEADADTLADFPSRDAFAERVDSPNDYMTGHARIGDTGNEAIHGDGVGMADAPGFDAKANLACFRIDERTLHEVRFSRRSDLNGAISGHGGGFLSGFFYLAGGGDQFPAYANNLEDYWHMPASGQGVQFS